MLGDLVLENIREEQPSDTEPSQQSGNEAHERVEGTGRVTRVERHGEGLIRQHSQPCICITESASDASQITSFFLSQEDGI